MATKTQSRRLQDTWAIVIAIYKASTVYTSTKEWLRTKEESTGRDSTVSASMGAREHIL